MYFELHGIAYLHISFISLVAMELTSSGGHGAGGLEAVQGLISIINFAGTSGEGIRYAAILQYYPLSLARPYYSYQVHSKVFNITHSYFSVISWEWGPCANKAPFSFCTL
jgi:hypothetical protein